MKGAIHFKKAAVSCRLGMIRDLLQWVKGEQREKVREIIWAVLLQKGVGLDSVAKVADLAPALCEADPITRNNAVLFLYEHFPPEEVVGSLVQFSVLSGRSVPSVAYRRYVSLLKGQGGLERNKEVVNRILSSATLEERHIKEIFLDYVSSLNRFDLIGSCLPRDGSFSGISDLRRKGGQMGFPFDVRKTLQFLDDVLRLDPARVTGWNQLGNRNTVLRNDNPLPLSCKLKQFRQLGFGFKSADLQCHLDPSSFISN
jgi:hypothetical protein